jgi:NAD+ kinase
MCAKAPQTFDLLLTLGGDGTVLYTSSLFQKVVPPVLAFALGSLGFLTKFDFGKYQDTLSTVLKDGFHVNLRLRFEATIMRKKHEGESKDRDIVDELIGSQANSITHSPLQSHHILNDIVLDRGPSGSELMPFSWSC